MSACDAGEVEETPLTCGLPSVRPSTGAASASSTTTDPTIASQRRRSTRVATAAHNRLRVTAGLRLGQFSLGPTELSRAGTSVSEMATLNSGISRPPSPMLRRKGIGTSTSAARDTATVTPLKTTDRPAVAIATRTASSLSAPRARSSRHRVTTRSE